MVYSELTEYIFSSSCFLSTFRDVAMKLFQAIASEIARCERAKKSKNLLIFEECQMKELELMLVGETETLLKTIFTKYFIISCLRNTYMNSLL